MKQGALAQSEHTATGTVANKHGATGLRTTAWLLIALTTLTTLAGCDADEHSADAFIRIRVVGYDGESLCELPVQVWSTSAPEVLIDASPAGGCTYLAPIQCESEDDELYSAWALGPSPEQQGGTAVVVPGGAACFKRPWTEATIQIASILLTEPEPAQTSRTE